MKTRVPQFSGPILLTALSVGLASIAAFADTSPIDFPGVLHPNWENSSVATFDFTKKGDLRASKLDTEMYSLNPSGEITGSELLAIVQPMSYPDFQKVQLAQKPAALVSVDDYRSYLGELLGEAIPVLSLNRIIDNEAMKRKLTFDVSDLRVGYIFSAVLAQNAISSGKIKSTDDSTRLSYLQLYGWLKDVVGANPVTLHMDWRFCDGGLHIACDSLEVDRLTFPDVKLSFASLPATWQEFSDQIRAQLEPVQTNLVRQKVWKQLVQEKNPTLGNALLFPGTTLELDRLYDAVKDQVFTTVKMHALTDQIKISGIRAKDFKNALNGKIAEQEALESQDLKLTPDQITALRKAIPEKVLNGVLADFSTDVAKGNLKVDFSIGALSHDSSEDLPTDDSIGSQQLRTAFNPLFLSAAVFPWFQVVDGDGFRTMFLREMITDQTSYLSRQDVRVTTYLEQKIKMKEQLSSYRDVAYKLFEENPIEVSADFCAEIPWPCVYPDSKGMANALFPEKLFPGQSLGNESLSGQPIQSTLLRPTSLEKVLDISGEIFQLAFQISDAKR